MKASEILMQEHRLIERVLDALEIAAGHLERSHAVAPAFFLEAADFIAGFADGCHHRKEEGVLFGAMIESGVPSGACVPGSHFGYSRTVSGPMPLIDS